jgi:hypothetical protein
MELEEMKATWLQMDRVLQKQDEQIMKIEVDRQLGRARRGLRPLFWGQVCQMLVAIGLMILAANYWTENRDVWYRLASGIVVHVYAVITVVLAGITISRIVKIDYSSPVVVIQKQLAKLRSFYILSGMLTGLPWWLLWMPVMAVIFGLLGSDLFANSPGLVLWCTVGGVVGLIGTLLFHRWAHQPKRSGLGRRLDINAAGGSLAKAQKALREIQQFEME